MPDNRSQVWGRLQPGDLLFSSLKQRKMASQPGDVMSNSVWSERIACSFHPQLAVHRQTIKRRHLVILLYPCFQPAVPQSSVLFLFFTSEASRPKSLVGRGVGQPQASPVPLTSRGPCLQAQLALPSGQYLVSLSKVCVLQLLPCSNSSSIALYQKHGHRQLPKPTERYLFLQNSTDPSIER